jgi:hypothetical protein
MFRRAGEGGGGEGELLGRLGEWWERALREGLGWRRSSRFICIKSICTVQGLGLGFLYLCFLSPI